MPVAFRSWVLPCRVEGQRPWLIPKLQFHTGMGSGDPTCAIPDCQSCGFERCKQNRIVECCCAQDDWGSTIRRCRRRSKTIYAVTAGRKLWVQSNVGARKFNKTIRRMVELISHKIDLAKADALLHLSVLPAVRQNSDEPDRPANG